MNRNPAPPQVLWVIWLALLSGMGFILMFVGGGWPSGEGEPVSFSSPIFLAAFGAFLASFVIRWGVVPKMRGQRLISTAIVGMALAEGCLILGIFALPETAVLSKQILIVLAFLGVASFAPIYARA